MPKQPDIWNCTESLVIQRDFAEWEAGILVVPLA